jgi:hypothetical protein
MPCGDRAEELNIRVCRQPDRSGTGLANEASHGESGRRCGCTCAYQGGGKRAPDRRRVGKLPWWKGEVAEDGRRGLTLVAAAPVRCGGACQRPIFFANTVAASPEGEILSPQGRGRLRRQASPVWVMTWGVDGAKLH